MKIHISSKKQIIQVLMLFVVPLVLFLVGYNFYTMQAMNERVAESNRSTVYLYKSSLEKDLQDIDLFLANLVVGDTNFQRLRSPMDPLEAHLCSKQIINRYQEMIATKRIIGGMFLFTEPNGLHREAYGGSYTYTVKEQLRSYLEELTGSGEIDRSRWQIYSMGDEDFLLRILGSGGVYSVCAVDLNRSLRPQDSTDPQNGVLLYAAPDGQLLNGQSRRRFKFSGLRIPSIRLEMANISLCNSTPRWQGSGSSI